MVSGPLPATLPVVCGSTTGQLVVATGKIRRNEKEYTPTEFERLGGKSAAKKWKQSIRLLEYEQDGQISLHTLGLGDWLTQNGLEIRANLLMLVTGPATLASPSPAPMAIPPPLHQHQSEHRASLTQQHLQQPVPQQHAPLLRYSTQPSLHAQTTEGAGQSGAAASSGGPQASSAQGGFLRQQEALATMQAYLEGRPLPPTPLALELGKEVAHLRVCGRPVDLRLLYVMVREAGGYLAVQRNQAWGPLAARCVQQQQQQQRQSAAPVPEDTCSLYGASHSRDDDIGNTSSPMLPSPFSQLRHAAPSTHALLCSGVRATYERFLLCVEHKEQLLLQCGLGGLSVALAARTSAPTVQQLSAPLGPNLLGSQIGPNLSASASLLTSPSALLDQRYTAAAAGGMDVEPPPQQQHTQQPQEQLPQDAGSGRTHASDAAETMSMERTPTAWGPFSQVPLLLSFFSTPLPQLSQQPQPPQTAPAAAGSGDPQNPGGGGTAAAAFAAAAAAAAAASRQVQSSVHSMRRTLSATKTHGSSGSSLRRRSQVRLGRPSSSLAGADVGTKDSAAAAAAAAAAQRAPAGAQQGASGMRVRKGGPLLAGQRSLLREYQEGASSVVDTSRDNGCGGVGNGDMAAGSPFAGSQGQVGWADSCLQTHQLLLEQAAALSLGSCRGSGEFGAGVGGGVGQGGARNLGGGGGGEGALGSSRLRQGSGLQWIARSGEGGEGDGSMGGSGDLDGGGGSGGGACSRGEVRAPKRSYEELQSGLAAGDVSACREEWAAGKANEGEGKGDRAEAGETVNPRNSQGYHRARSTQQPHKRMLSLNGKASQQVGMLLHQLGSGHSNASFPPSTSNAGFLSPTAAPLHCAWQQQQQQEQQQQQQPSLSSAFPLLAFPRHRPTLSSPLLGQQDAVSPALLPQQPQLQPPQVPLNEGLPDSLAQGLLLPAAQPSQMLGTPGSQLTSNSGGWNSAGGGGGGSGEVAWADAPTAVDVNGNGGLGLWEAPGPGSGPDLHTLMAMDMCGGLQDEDEYFDGLMECIGGGEDGGNLGVVGDGNSNATGSQQLLPGSAALVQQPGPHGALLNDATAAAAAAAAATAPANTATAAHHRPPLMLAPHHPQTHVPLQPCNSGSSSNTTNDATASAGAEGGSAVSAPHIQNPFAAHSTLAHAFTSPPHACFRGLPQFAMSGALHQQLAVGEPVGEMLQQLPLTAPALSGHLAQGLDSKTSCSSSMGGAPHSSVSATAAHTPAPFCDVARLPMVDAPLFQAQPPAHSTDLPEELYQVPIHDLN